MYEPPHDLIVCCGACCTVALAIRGNGKCEADDFLQALQLADSAKLLRLFQLMADKGRIWNDQKYRHLRDGIYEFKGDRSLRVLAFQAGTTHYLTHGFRKQTSKCPPGEIMRAVRIRAEHPTQEQEG